MLTAHEFYSRARQGERDGRPLGGGKSPWALRSGSTEIGAGDTDRRGRRYQAYRASRCASRPHMSARTSICSATRSAPTSAFAGSGARRTHGIEAAARAAAPRIHHGISALAMIPRWVGEHGKELSRRPASQRIAVARRWSQNAPIILLDEATAAMARNREAGAGSHRAPVPETNTSSSPNRLHTIMQADAILWCEGGE